MVLTGPQAELPRLKSGVLKATTGPCVESRTVGSFRIAVYCVAPALLAGIIQLATAGATPSGRSYSNARASCHNQVLQKLKKDREADVATAPVLSDRLDSPEKMIASPNGRAREAECVANAGFLKQGYENALAALATEGTNRNETILSALADIAKMRGDQAAYSRFLRLEAVAERKNLKDIGVLNASLCGSDSTDEQNVCNKERAAPDHVQTFTSAGRRVVTWWYGTTSYRKAYTFTNGVLTSTYTP